MIRSYFQNSKICFQCDSSRCVFAISVGKYGCSQDGQIHVFLTSLAKWVPAYSEQWQRNIFCSRREKASNCGNAGEDDGERAHDCGGERRALNVFEKRKKKLLAFFTTACCEPSSFGKFGDLVCARESVYMCVCVCIPAGVPLDWMGLAALTCRLRVSMAFIFASQLTHLDLVPIQPPRE